MQTNAAALTELMHEMRQTLVRIIRSSAADVDRRGMRRHALDIRCRLTVPGHAVLEARLTDLSAGGARIEGAPALPVGTLGTLAPDGMAETLPFVVRYVAGDALGIEFELTDRRRDAGRHGGRHGAAGGGLIATGGLNPTIFGAYPGDKRPRKAPGNGDGKMATLNGNAVDWFVDRHLREGRPSGVAFEDRPLPDPNQPRRCDEAFRRRAGPKRHRPGAPPGHADARHGRLPGGVLGRAACRSRPGPDQYAADARYGQLRSPGQPRRSRRDLRATATRILATLRGAPSLREIIVVRPDGSAPAAIGRSARGRHWTNSSPAAIRPHRPSRPRRTK